MRLTMIVAVSENNVIGRDNALPWHLPADLQRFKRLTTGHTIIMGRKTWESIGRPLPHRRSVVISRTPGFDPPGAVVAPDMATALALAGESGEVFVIGGSRVFEAALPLTHRLELTRVHAILPGDAYFPPINFSEWNLVGEERHAADAQHAFSFTFFTYDRR